MLMISHMCIHVFCGIAGLCSAVGIMSDSRARGPKFDFLSRYMLLFPLPLIQEEQLAVTALSTS